MLAERSKASTVFARSNPTQCRDVYCLCVCVFLCLCTSREALRRADHPSKESYRLFLIKKLRKFSPMLQKREQAPKCGSNEEEKKGKKGKVVPVLN
jgi:hypothetical protein